MERELTAANLVIACWSKNVSGSQAVADAATRGADTDKLIAISLDGTEPPADFKHTDAIDFRADEKIGHAALLRMINSKIGGVASGDDSAVLTGAPLSPHDESAGKRLLHLAIGAGIAIICVVIAYTFWLTAAE